MVPMFGWFKAEAAFASCTKRRFRSGSETLDGGRTGAGSQGGEAYALNSDRIILVPTRRWKPRRPIHGHHWDPVERTYRGRMTHDSRRFSASLARGRA